MSEHAVSSHGADPVFDFSPAEWAELHADDIVAGKTVVSLMMGIFCMGLVIYTIVVIAVST